VPVREPEDPSTPPPPAGRRRARKFVLPEHHHDEVVDERATEHIEAFIDGPVAPPRRRPGADSDRVRRPIQLETRPDWIAALRYEAARHFRYGRPASVLVIELTGPSPSVEVDEAARAVADAIRAEARETDRAVRVGALSFRVLLPETGGRAARTLADRLDRAYRAGANGQGDTVDLCVEVATAPRNGALEEALAEAERRMAARSEVS
jgi:GGDEF domain-containing protein